MSSLVALSGRVNGWGRRDGACGGHGALRVVVSWLVRVVVESRRGWTAGSESCSVPRWDGDYVKFPVGCRNVYRSCIKTISMYGRFYARMD